MNSTTPSSDHNIFGPATRLLTVKKRDFVLGLHEMEQYVYYLISGAVYMQVETLEGNQCVGFYTEGDYFSAYASFLTQKVSPYSIQAIENCKIAAIHYHDLQAAYQNSAQHERNGRLMSEQLFLRSNQRNVDLLCLSAEERYLKLMKEQTEVVKRFPQKLIASYLGITPVSLSRIRRKILA